MKKIEFPDGTTVGSLGQGTWFMGEDPARKTEEIEALRTGVDLGMTVIDTAEMYGDGHSEVLVGEAVKGIRKDVYLVTKVLPQNADYEGTKKACENSLRRLGTDYVDLYLLHWAGPHPIEETVRAMTELRREGKILNWGVSNLDVDEIEDFMSVEGGKSCATNEVLYNLMRRGIEYDLLPWCREHKMPVIAYSPIERGKLAFDTTLRHIAARHNATPSQIALAWVLREPNILAIPKASSVAHVRDNYGALSIQLTEEDMKWINEAFPAPTRKMPLEMI